MTSERNHICDFIFIGLFKPGSDNEFFVNEDTRVFEINSPTLSLYQTLLGLIKLKPDLFVICQIVSESDDLITVQVVFKNYHNIKDDTSCFNSVSVADESEDFSLLYGNFDELMMKKVPTYLFEYKIKGISFISVKCLLAKLMENPLSIMLTSKSLYYRQIFGKLSDKEVLSTRQVSKTLKSLVSRNFRITLPDDFEYSERNITKLCKSFNKEPNECTFNINWKINYLLTLNSFSENMLIMSKLGVKMVVTITLINIRTINMDDIFSLINDAIGSTNSILSLTIDNIEDERWEHSLPWFIRSNFENFTKAVLNSTELYSLSIRGFKMLYKTLIPFLTKIPKLSELKLFDCYMHSEIDFSYFFACYPDDDLEVNHPDQDSDSDVTVNHPDQDSDSDVTVNDDEVPDGNSDVTISDDETEYIDDKLSKDLTIALKNIETLEITERSDVYDSMIKIFLPCLKYLSFLKNLKLRIKEIVNLDDLQYLTTLTSLDLSNTDLNDITTKILFPFIANLTNIKTLKLKNTEMYDNDARNWLGILQGLPFLTCLDVSKNHLGSQAIENLRRNLPMLTEFYAGDQITYD